MQIRVSEWSMQKTDWVLKRSINVSEDHIEKIISAGIRQTPECCRFELEDKRSFNHVNPFLFDIN
jgi:hypothetical protein